MAVLTAQRTTCIRRAVGCVLLNENGHVVGTGNNGVARGMPHCNEQTGFNFVYANGINKKKPLTGQATSQEPVYGHACKGHDLPPGQDKCEAVHAEVNALLQCSDVQEARYLYVTLSPCLACTKILLNTGVFGIYSLEQWHDPASEELWKKAGRAWHRFQFPLDHAIIST